MRRKSPDIDHKALASIGEKPKSVLTTEGQPLVPGLLARRRGNKLVWLMRYRAGKVQRELVLGYESDFGVRGRLAQFGVTGDIAAELLASKGAKEQVPADLIGTIAARVRHLVDGGADPVADRQAAQIKEQRAATDHRFKDYAEQFLNYGRKKRGKPLRPATLKEYRRALMVYAKSLHGRSVKEIDKKEISGLIAATEKEHGAISANRMRAALSRFFGWLDSSGELAYGNPVTGTPTYATDPRNRVLADDELRALWAATDNDSDFAAIVRLMLWTGARRSEVAGMHSAELTPDGWLLPAERAKNGRELLLPLSRQARP